MTPRMTTVLIAALLLCWGVELTAGGGPWALKPGKVRITAGYSKKTSGSRWINGEVENPPDSTLVDGLFHDFRYGYIMPEIGVFENFEVSALILYLWGYERAFETDPVTKARHPIWELNQGFTDSWLFAKYQILDGEFPLAVQLSTRFPDLYDEEGPYTRYMLRVTSHPEVRMVGDSQRVVTVNDTHQVPTAEWRGLLKRDLGIHLLAGHAFDDDGYVQGELAYNFREDAYADQVIVALSGGYNHELSEDFTLMPKLAFDYTHGVGNGEVPDSTDRFQFRTLQEVPGTNLKANLPTANYYFNNARYGRLYGSVGVGYLDKYSLELGYGRWLFGDGAAIYNELYAQFSVAL